ncbi:PLDc N-terminal domain-containing protein [Psychromicrobium xiongbiense]|uniref:PLDc N-terminal domain-containing protein n=1 Tax=Psychromicrobium xiongbiense TaxID=3051184 RepID=UPI002557781A|nr:PLDc N-terminal domain-containing protein [Psychromicrobium sp. YIM S02556]
MSPEPQIPGWFSALGAVTTIVWFALFVLTLVMILRSAYLSPAQRAVWSIIVVLLPVLGSLVWIGSFLLGRRRASGKERSAAQPTASASTRLSGRP